MANYHGLGVGRKRVGLSSDSDDLGIALPGGALPASKRTFFLHKIADFVREMRADVVVVGYPFGLDGSKNNICIYVDEFVPALKLLTGDDATFAIFDESLMSNQAKADLCVARGAKYESSEHKRKLPRTEVVDFNAAAVILQGYFDELAMRTQLNE
jgi:putative transcription antitermination factor YqgF